MANISDVTGEFQLINGDVLEKEQVHQVLKMMKDELEEAEYATFINTEENQTIEETNNFIESGYEYLFNGTGRWTYQNNVENMFEWITNNEHNYDDLLHTLEIHNIQFVFNFVEYEPGLMPDFLNTMLIVVQPYFDKNEGRFKTQVLDISEGSDIPITDQSLIKYGFIDDGVLTLDDIKNRTNEALIYFDEEEIEEWLEENEDEFKDADGTINVYVPENEIFVPSYQLNK